MGGEQRGMGTEELDMAMHKPNGNKYRMEIRSKEMETWMRRKHLVNSL